MVPHEEHQRKFMGLPIEDTIDTHYYGEATTTSRDRIHRRERPSKLTSNKTIGMVLSKEHLRKPRGLEDMTEAHY